MHALLSFPLYSNSSLKIPQIQNVEVRKLCILPKVTSTCLILRMYFHCKIAFGVEFICTIWFVLGQNSQPVDWAKWTFASIHLFLFWPSWNPIWVMSSSSLCHANRNLALALPLACENRAVWSHCSWEGDLAKRESFYVGQLTPWATNKAVIYYEICSLSMWVMGSWPLKVEQD